VDREPAPTQGIRKGPKGTAVAKKKKVKS
jgi:hypothetical protein